MSRFLIATWDGAGNLVPTLGIACTLVERGHEVRILGHETILERCGDVPGARFVPLTQGAGWDAIDDPADAEAEMKLLMDELCFSSTIARDLAEELNRRPADAVLVDCLLFMAIDVALASGTPTATLFHSAYTLFRSGPLTEMFASGVPIVNAQRTKLGLPAIERLGDVHDACAYAIVAVPEEFECAPDAANVLRIGPVDNAPALSCRIDDVDVRAGSTPLVLVSLSTSEQGQAGLLQRCVDAVARLPVRAVVTTGPSIDPGSIRRGRATQVVQYVPHAEIIPHASLVITHAGMGTTMAALGHGVPLLCAPMGRDQFYNAERVQVLGAGRMVMPDSTVDEIAQAATDVLDDPRFAASAKRVATAITSCGGAREAADALEALAGLPSSTRGPRSGATPGEAPARTSG
jgi:UDP:flavonoid glycosyltransferase YjiC (YdhE family)